MSLDEELFGYITYWTSDIQPEYPVDYAWPEKPDYKNPIVGLVSSGNRWRYDFETLDGQNSN